MGDFGRMAFGVYLAAKRSGFRLPKLEPGDLESIFDSRFLRHARFPLTAVEDRVFYRQQANESSNRP